MRVGKIAIALVIAIIANIPASFLAPPPYGGAVALLVSVMVFVIALWWLSRRPG